MTRPCGESVSDVSVCLSTVSLQTVCFPSGAGETTHIAKVVARQRSSKKTGRPHLVNTQMRVKPAAPLVLNGKIVNLNICKPAYLKNNSNLSSTLALFSMLSFGLITQLRQNNLHPHWNHLCRVWSSKVVHQGFHSFCTRDCKRKCSVLYRETEQKKL